MCKAVTFTIRDRTHRRTNNSTYTYHGFVIACDTPVLTSLARPRERMQARFRQDGLNRRPCQCPMLVDATCTVHDARWRGDRAYSFRIFFRAPLLDLLALWIPFFCVSWTTRKMWHLLPLNVFLSPCLPSGRLVGGLMLAFRLLLQGLWYNLAAWGIGPGYSWGWPRSALCVCASASHYGTCDHPSVALVATPAFTGIRNRPGPDQSVIFYCAFLPWGQELPPLRRILFLCLHLSSHKCVATYGVISYVCLMYVKWPHLILNTLSSKRVSHRADIVMYATVDRQIKCFRLGALSFQAPRLCLWFHPLPCGVPTPGWPCKDSLFNLGVCVKSDSKTQLEFIAFLVFGRIGVRGLHVHLTSKALRPSACLGDS